MPTYDFHLRDNEALVDTDGADFANVGAAREHAIGVAHELMCNSRGIPDRDWSCWTMSVNNENGDEREWRRIFSFTL